MARHVHHETTTVTTRPVDDRSRFGGVDWPATIAGCLSAIGVLVLLGGLLAAAGSFGYQTTEGTSSGTEEITDGVAIGGVAAGMFTLLVAFLVGGWVAGRVARYDGGRNGLLSALWFVLVAAGLAALGTWAGDRYNVFEDIDLPNWFSNEDATTTAIVSAAVGILVCLVAGWLGGKLGERYHRRADAAVVDATEIDVREHVVEHDHVDLHDHDHTEVSGPALVGTTTSSTTGGSTLPPPPPAPTADNTVVTPPTDRTTGVVVGDTHHIHER